MNYITYDEGVDMTLNWDYEKLLCVAFVEEGCDACDSFFNLVCPELENMDIEVRCLDLRKNTIPFPVFASEGVGNLREPLVLIFPSICKVPLPLILPSTCSI